jgi:hypothetical protein
MTMHSSDSWLKQEASNEGHLKSMDGDHLRQGLLSEHLSFHYSTLLLLESSATV